MAKPTLALIPASQGSKVFSVLPSSGVGDFNFSRGSAATRINSQGLIENVLSGQSRLEYPLIDGVVSGCPSLLLEPQRTNLITYSEDFSQSEWNKQQSGTASVPIVTSNYGISPDGTQNADRVQLNLNNGTSGSDISFIGDYLTTISSATSGSFYLKSLDGIKNVRIRNGNAILNVDVTTQWKRFIVTDEISSNKLQLMLYGNSNSQSADLLIYGAQLEQGSYPTSYIPTNGTTVTRLAETANGAGDATTFNDSEGVLMVEASALANDGTNRQISISNGTTAQRIYFGLTTNSNEFILSSRDSSYIQVTVSDVLNFNKYAFQYKTGNFKAFINGFNYNLTLDGGLLPTGLNTLNFDAGNGGSDFYGKTKQIQYFDTALNDSDLEELTSWESFTAMAQGQTYSIK